VCLEGESSSLNMFIKYGRRERAACHHNQSPGKEEKGRGCKARSSSWRLFDTKGEGRCLLFLIHIISDTISPSVIKLHSSPTHHEGKGEGKNA